MSDEQWGPWIEHDGSGCPDNVRGRVIHVIFEAPDASPMENSGLMVDAVMAHSWRAPRDADAPLGVGRVGDPRIPRLPALTVAHARQDGTQLAALVHERHPRAPRTGPLVAQPGRRPAQECLCSTGGIHRG